MNTLTDFHSYLSESFYRKIHLLEKIIGDRHWLTSGVFKEKILLNFLNSTLPKKLKAKSGFIIFPSKKRFTDNKVPEYFDKINSSAFEISKQIDIIIYDKLNFSPIYSDKDIVICSPESVIGIIEVKGVLNTKYLEESINTLNDFTRKWERYKKFRKNAYLNTELPKTRLYIFAWELKKTKKGYHIKGKTIRDRLAQNLRKVTTQQNFEEIPIISKLFVYNEYEIDFTHYIYGDDESVGYNLSRGNYVYFDENGEPISDRDRTIFMLLRDLLSLTGSLHNRLLSDPDEANREDPFMHQETGYSKVYDIKV